jgi:hypothetical protein
VSIPISWVLSAHHTALETARRDQEIKKAVQEHRADELGDIMKYHPETPAALEAGKALVAMRQSALETLTCSPKVRGFVQSRLQSLENGQVLKPIRVRVVPPPASEIEELARRLRATDKENLLAQLDDASLVDVLRSELEERVPDSAIQDGWKRAALSDVMQLTRGERVGESQLPREVSEPTLFISYNNVKSKPAAKLAFHVVLRVPGSPDVVDLNTKVEMPWTDVEARRRRVEQSGRPSIAVSDVVADVYIRLKGQLEEAFCLRGK